MFEKEKITFKEGKVVNSPNDSSSNIINNVEINVYNVAEMIHHKRSNHPTFHKLKIVLFLFFFFIS